MGEERKICAKMRKSRTRGWRVLNCGAFRRNVGEGLAPPAGRQKRNLYARLGGTHPCLPLWGRWREAPDEGRGALANSFAVVAKSNCSPTLISQPSADSFSRGSHGDFCKSVLPQGIGKSFMNEKTGGASPSPTLRRNAQRLKNHKCCFPVILSAAMRRTVTAFACSGVTGMSRPVCQRMRSVSARAFSSASCKTSA